MSSRFWETANGTLSLTPGSWSLATQKLTGRSTPPHCNSFEPARALEPDGHRVADAEGEFIELLA